MKIKGLFLGIILTICGFLMLFLPKFCVTLIAIFISAAIFINGFYNLFFTYKNCDNPYYKKSLLIKGSIGLVIGLLGLIAPVFFVKTFSAIWSLVNYIAAFVLIFFSALGFYTNTKVKDSGKDEKQASIKESVIFLLIATILILLAAAPNTIFRIVGTVSLVTGLFLCLIEVLKNKKGNTSIVKAEDKKDAVDVEASSSDDEDSEEKEEE